MYYKFVSPRFLGEFRRISEAAGLQLAAQTTLSELGITVRLHGTFAPTGPQLIISNHPSPLDGLSVLSVIPRPDVYTVAVAANTALGQPFVDHMLPVYFSNQPRYQLIDYVRVPINNRLEGNLSREEAMSRNRVTITRAAQLVNQGHTVIIFPGGTSSSTKTPWKKGVGYLLQSLTEPDTAIVLAHLEGGQWHDLLRATYAGPLTHWFPRTFVEIHTEKYKLNDFDCKKSGPALAREVESIYRLRWQD